MKVWEEEAMKLQEEIARKKQYQNNKVVSNIKKT